MKPVWCSSLFLSRIHFSVHSVAERSAWISALEGIIAGRPKLFDGFLAIYEFLTAQMPISCHLGLLETATERSLVSFIPSILYECITALKVKSIKFVRASEHFQRLKLQICRRDV